MMADTVVGPAVRIKRKPSAMPAFPRHDRSRVINENITAKVKKFDCTWCDKEFSSRCHLERHEQSASHVQFKMLVECNSSAAVTLLVVEEDRCTYMPKSFASFFRFPPPKRDFCAVDSTAICVRRNSLMRIVCSATIDRKHIKNKLKELQ